jgi:preprotein translocase subunit SecG
VLEKGTWIFASVIAILAITSTLFLSKGNGGSGKNVFEKLNTTPGTQQNATPPPPPPPPTKKN